MTATTTPPSTAGTAAAGPVAWWRTIPRGVRGAVIFSALLVLLMTSVGIVERATRGRESRTYDSRGSARSTATNGAKAFRLLLGHYDIATADLAGSLRTAANRTDLAADTTVFILDAPFPSDHARRTTHDIAVNGGRVVIAGTDAGEWITDPPTAARSSSRSTTVRLGRTYHAETASQTRWSTPHGPELVVTRAVGAGQIVLVADGSFLQNQWLGRRDNAALAVALAGDRGRAAFAEGVHGLSGATGWDAIPNGWKVAIIGSALALLLTATARGRRIGPAERAGRALDPPRRASADALGAAIARAKRPDAALIDLRTITRQRVIDVGHAQGTEADTVTDASVRAAAIAAGYSESEADALINPLTDSASVLALGRAFARSQRGNP